MKLADRLQQMGNDSQARDPTQNGVPPSQAMSTAPSSLPMVVSQAPQNQMAQASQVMQQQMMMQIASMQAEVQNQLSVMQGQAQFLSNAIAPMMADPNYMAQQLFSQLAEEGIYYGTIEENLVITIEE
ncbi:hypothetical protein [Aporhodopirellula aestuarii]|uniref:Uncharacterized protein n=1 Tax=Aporhodopirellula aestuarii TaxID=2950107 RepID=A0ABT0U577_9BACT|nr:hypothetical protein [Aporhodopirellula aestuarii]MCM2372080.1 hypothetical protein [Aporhodopirellula aestuarii]